jgi:polysaccharide deacetylase family protein (PEP-CTERM system associated)
MKSPKMKQKLSLSIDVEEWFHVENLKDAISKDTWNYLDNRVDKNCYKILSILEEKKMKATFFILGWIANRFPTLIKDISINGHEIASHGFDHEPVYKLSKEQFRDDLLRSKEILEKHSGQRITGFRAPTFSMTDWALDILKENGFLYDSSYQPQRAIKEFNDRIKNKSEKNIIRLENGLYEVILSSRKIFGFFVPWSGGGYFRLLPYSIFKRGINQILIEKNSYCFYIHPWEFDPDQPKIHVPFIKRFKHYHALSKTEKKFRSLLGDFQFSPIYDMLSTMHSKPHPR